MAAALAAGEVTDLAGARRADRRRRELESSRDQLSATLGGLCGDDQVEQLHARLAQLRAGQVADVGMDSSTARTALAAAEADRTRSAAVCDERRRQAATAAAQLAETITRTTVLRGKVATQRAELHAVADRLAAQRSVITDDDLAAGADADRRAEAVAGQRVADLTARLDAAGATAVAAELADAAATAEALRSRHDETERALHEVTVELTVFGTEGRQGQLDAARNAYEHAKAEQERVGRRARAAQLLRSVMARHRDTTRLRYVEPFRTELQRLGRPVFGPSFEVEIDSDLSICSRTLDGRTVPYESLSGGAKEQLGILARLAGASLVTNEEPSRC